MDTSEQQKRLNEIDVEITLLAQITPEKLYRRAAYNRFVTLVLEKQTPEASINR